MASVQKSQPQVSRPKLAGGALLFLVGSYVAFSAILYLTSGYSLCWLQQTCTYYSEPSLWGSVWSLPGLWLQQWCVTPCASAAVVAAPLALTALFLLMALRSLGLCRFWPLAMLPSAVLALTCARSLTAVGLALPLAALVWAISYGYKAKRGIVNTKRKSWRPVTFMAAVLAGAVYGLWRANADPERERMCRMLVVSGQEDWQQIASLTNTQAQLPPLEPPLRSLALAKQGRLADLLFQRPCTGLADLYPQVATPEAFVVLSDIHWHCGEYALSQRYAFEANEAYGNLSPRLLQRLVDTNLLLGHPVVALKYISLLEKTHAYADWGARRRTVALGYPHAVAEDPDLGPLLAALPDDNKFAGMPDNSADLRSILRVCPGQTVAMQYLGCRYLLSRDLPAFTDYIAEQSSAGTLPSPLPVHYQEGLAVASIATGTPLDRRYGVEPAVTARCTAFWQGRSSEPATLWQYLRQAK